LPSPARRLVTTNEEECNLVSPFLSETGKTMRDNRKLTEDEKKEEVGKALKQAGIHRKKKRFQKGIDLLLDALRYQIEEDQIYYQLGNIYHDAGDLDQAENAYQRAIEKNKEHANAHHNLGVVYKRKGRIWEFVKMKKKATRLAIKTRVK
jgi:tetratricopeptide (TPR) repeat protein